jgi:hypothetical protein
MEFNPNVESEQTSGSIQQGAGNGQPKYATSDDLKSLRDEITRQMQSLTDKAENRITRQIREQIAQAQMVYDEVGKSTLPPDVQARLAQQALEQLNSGGAAHAQSGVPTDVIRATNMAAQALVEDAGIEFGPDDPEFSLVNLNAPDPKSYLASVRKAVAAKAQRLQSNPTAQQAQPQQAQQGNPAARLPNVGAGASASGDLMAQYQREAASVRPGSEELLQLRRKYRSKGLSI